MTTDTSACATEVAQARATAYTLIAFGFQYPDRTSLEALAAPQRWADWPGVLRAVYSQADQPLREFRDVALSCVRRAKDRADSEPNELRSRFDELFGHAVRGKCPAYEMEYGRHEIIRQASDLADIAGFYHAFSLEFADGADARPDHIAAECEFLSTVCAKEAYALAQDDEDNVAVCVKAERAFLKDHLARWLPAFATRVEAADPGGVYGALARFADAFVHAECGHFDVQAGPQTLELTPRDPVLDRTISCGPADCGGGESAEQLIQLGTDVPHRAER